MSTFETTIFSLRKNFDCVYGWFHISSFICCSIISYLICKLSFSSSSQLFCTHSRAGLQDCRHLCVNIFELALDSLLSGFPSHHSWQLCSLLLIHYASWNAQGIFGCFHQCDYDPEESGSLKSVQDKPWAWVKLFHLMYHPKKQEDCLPFAFL